VGHNSMRVAYNSNNLKMGNGPVSDRYRLITICLLLGVFMVAMGLRLYDLDRNNLDGDELFTGNWSRLDPRSIVARTALDVHPPLNYLITRLFVLLLGSSDFVVRLPAVLIGSLSVFVAYKAGEVLWTRTEGLLGAYLLAIAPYHVEYSQYARHYALMVFLALLSLIFLLKALETGRKAMWIGFVLCTVLGLYNVYFAFLILGIQVVYAIVVIASNWLRCRRTYSGPQPTGSRPVSVTPRDQALMLGLSLALVGLLFLPWLPTMLRQILGHHIGFEGFGGETMPGVYLSAEWFRSWLTEYSSVDGASLMLLLGLFVAGLVSCGRKQALLVTLWLATPFVFAFFVSAKHVFVVRDGFYILPICLLVIGRGTASSARLAGRIGAKTRIDRHHATMAIFALAVVVFGGLSLEPLQEYYSRQKTDWRGTARYLAEHLATEDVLLVDGVSYKAGRDASRVLLGLPYYLAAHGVTDETLFTVGTGLWRNLQAHVEQGQGRVWGVLWYSANAPSWQGEVHASMVDFPGILIIRPPEPSGYMVQDAVSILHILLDLMPTQEGCFDIHLALAEIHLRTLRLEEAESELEKASVVQPGDLSASQVLAKALADFEDTSSAMEGMQHPLWRNIGQEIALAGYDMHPTPASLGELLRVTLWWGALQSMDRDYTAFVHVLGPDGQILAQEDRLLSDASLLTSRWRPGGAPMRDQYELPLPADTEPGQYTVVVGVYYWETGVRLPVWDDLGQRVQGDAISLGELDVED
jgi:hypothetical protein